MLTPGLRLHVFCLAWLSGVFLHLNEAALWPASRYLALAVVGGSGVALARRNVQSTWGRVAATLALLLGALSMGWGSSAWQAALRLAERLDPALEGQEVLIEGTVSGLPQRGASGWRFRFDVSRAMLRGETVVLPRRLSLGWYLVGLEEGATMPEPMRSLAAGQAWRFSVRLKPPHGSLNPHGLDLEQVLFQQGVRATGQVRAGSGAAPRLLDAQAAHPVERLRQKLRDRVQAAVTDPRAAGVLAALAMGDQSAIAPDDWQLFRNTGVAHLMSISGLHITMFAWMAAGLLGWAWRRSGRWMLWLPAVAVARWGGAASAAAYALFSGWGVPAQRTVWMLVLVSALQSGSRRWPWPPVLLCAAVGVTAFDPWALLQPGFWLSFMAVALLMASGADSLAARGTASPAPDAISPPTDGACPTAPGASTRLPGLWRSACFWLLRTLAQAMRSQALACLGLAPLTLMCFQQVSLVGYLANLAAIPLVTLILTPLALLGALWPLAWTAGACVERSMVHLLEALSGLPLVVWSVPLAPAWAQGLGLLAAALWVLPIPWRLRALALPLLMPMLQPVLSRPAEGDFELLAADVGQGTSVLVRTRGHLMLFDTGPRYAPGSDAGQRVLLPLLLARGETRIDRLVLSHRDLDHVGGAEALMAQWPIGDLLSSLEPGHPLLGRAARAERCDAGQSWQWDGVQFQVLHPWAADHAVPGAKPNALSCVIKVVGRRERALPTGDIEKAQEARLVASAVALRSDILVVAHHGSRTSSTAAFLDAVQPRVAVIQAGDRNRFGHPAADVLARLGSRGIPVRNNASCGAWQWRSGQPFDGRCQRWAERRYWHDPGPAR